MAHQLQTIRKRSTFVLIKNKGKIIRGKTFNIRILQNDNLDNSIYVGFTATKRIGKAVFRNKAKRRMRELAKKVLTKYGKINYYYVFIAKNKILDESFKSQQAYLEKTILL